MVRLKNLPENLVRDIQIKAAVKAAQAAMKDQTESPKQQILQPDETEIPIVSEISQSRSKPVISENSVSFETIEVPGIGQIPVLPSNCIKKKKVRPKPKPRTVTTVDLNWSDLFPEEKFSTSPAPIWLATPSGPKISTVVTVNERSIHGIMSLNEGVKNNFFNTIDAIPSEFKDIILRKEQEVAALPPESERPVWLSQEISYADPEMLTVANVCFRILEATLKDSQLSDESIHFLNNCLYNFRG